MWFTILENVSAFYALSLKFDLEAAITFSSDVFAYPQQNARIGRFVVSGCY